MGEVHGVLFFLNWDGSLEVGVSGSVVGSSISLLLLGIQPASEVLVLVLMPI